MVLLFYKQAPNTFFLTGAGVFHGIACDTAAKFF